MPDLVGSTGANDPNSLSNSGWLSAATGLIGTGLNVYGAVTGKNITGNTSHAGPPSPPATTPAPAPSFFSKYGLWLAIGAAVVAVLFIFRKR